MTTQDKDRIECAIRHIKTAVDVDPRAKEIAVEAMEKMLKDLPSVQPEIVRCKDCKWWDKKDDSPYGYCMAMKHGFMSSHWEIGIYRTYKGDFYCADAERRTDDKST